MAIVAPYSRYKRGNFKIVIGILLVVGVIFAYDGYLSQYEWSKRYSFYEEHVVSNGGKPDGTMLLNRKLPPCLFAGAALAAVWFVLVRGKKVVADESALHVGKHRISYDMIESVDKTHFDAKGYFIVTYRNDHGGTSRLRLSDRAYDNLPAVLDELVRQIT